MSKRYLLIKLLAEKPLSREQFGEAVFDSVRRSFGEIGLARIEPRVVRYDGIKGRAIIACRRDGAGELQAALALMSNVGGMELVPLVLGVSGTIRALGKRRSR